MNEEKKGFNLNVLISLLVGVISLIVIIPTVTMIMNKNRPEEVTPEEYRIILSKNYDYTLSFGGPSFQTKIILLSADLSDYDNLISISVTHDDIVMTVSDLEEGQYNFSNIYMSDGTYYGNYSFTYLDPVSNEKLYGTYDFSNITITEAGQVLNPIYTPFTTPYF